MKPFTIYKKGQKMHNCIFLSNAGFRYYPNNRIPLGRFLCECGNEFTARISSVKTGSTKSCGCLHLKNVRTHGLTNHPLFITWAMMKNRCYNKNDQAYHNYGGRGIKVCDQWRTDFPAYLKYVSALLNYKKNSYTIDRIDNDKNYEPGNLRWADKHFQSANQKLRRSNKSGYAGVNYTKSRKKWRSTIKVHNKSIWLGHHDTAESAVKARNNYIIKNGLHEYKIQ